MSDSAGPLALEIRQVGMVRELVSGVVRALRTRPAGGRILTKRVGLTRQKQPRLSRWEADVPDGSRVPEGLES